MKIINRKNKEGEDIKQLRSRNYNYDFNCINGFFIRWGETFKDDPEYSEYGPEILDIEISTSCSNGCSFCYKSNTAKGKNMTFENFKKLASKFPVTLTQIAFGIGYIDANPDLLRIMEYCRYTLKIIPNITINGKNMTDLWYDRLASVCGAVAVSLYDTNSTYNAVEELTKRMKMKGSVLKQVNIHCLLSKETLERCSLILHDKIVDKRLENLNAIVFLWLKPKGDRNIYHQLDSIEDLRNLINFAFEHNIDIGFDSCSAPNFLKSIKEHKTYKTIETMIEPCESTLFSYYINVDGIGYPCSFSEDVEGYKGIDVLNSIDFLKDVWNHEESKKFRLAVTQNKDENKCRMCPIYNLCVGECK